MPNSWDFEWLPKFKLRVFILLSELTYFFMMLLLNLSTPSLILPCFEGDPIIFENILPHVTQERDREKDIWQSCEHEFGISVSNFALTEGPKVCDLLWLRTLNQYPASPKFARGWKKLKKS